ncbi:hypothetical protein CP967_31100 [Streptomyces nitrosporeus]|uniref:Uncharacterized protein n=1 Tax=Streptomyces nitrosporeus TaxID=28894 RepID=A0A5J6FHY3_9ACTN|nr:hypothetical protein [Streptomyces nitrosporeus]QEU75823.1 hypothetical protein CP967_31100 [Streptomyces nitrosporeus]GGY88521.1 hypothetical protein GCM10010327_19050 [Streptomyces nitrosporeus]
MLFLLAELRALLGTPVTDERAQLAHDLAEDAIMGEVGERIATPPQRGIKTVALSVAARILTNPQGVRSEQAGGMLMTYADDQTGVVLSDDELRRLRRAVGMASGAGMLDIAPVESRISTYPWRQA